MRERWKFAFRDVLPGGRVILWFDRIGPGDGLSDRSLWLDDVMRVVEDEPAAARGDGGQA